MLLRTTLRDVPTPPAVLLNQAPAHCGTLVALGVLEASVDARAGVTVKANGTTATSAT
jgi:hypothetical protein